MPHKRQGAHTSVRYRGVRAFFCVMENICYFSCRFRCNMKDKKRNVSNIYHVMEKPCIRRKYEGKIF